MKKLENELETAVKAVRTAGEVLKQYASQEYRILRKSRKELVSEVDMRSQEVILQVLRTGSVDYSVLTEEKTDPIHESDRAWIVDPLDGTHNYVAGLPFSGVSVALADPHDFLLGVIYFPEEDLLFHAVQGEGAFRNGDPIHVSDNRDLSKAVVNYDNQFHLSAQSFVYYQKLVERAFTTRIFGTAVMDLCLIASGRIDGRIFLQAKAPDFAAGHVIVTEAGGQLTQFDGTPCTPRSGQIVASNGYIHSELLEVVKG